jgi:hypothetical protein
VTDAEPVAGSLYFAARKGTETQTGILSFELTQAARTGVAWYYTPKRSWSI